MKDLVIVLMGVVIIFGALYIVGDHSEDVEVEPAEEVTEPVKREAEEEEDVRVEEVEDMDNLISCLATNNLIIYGSKTCPFCEQLADSFGGYEKVESIYVECTEDPDECEENKLTGYVPEIQIEGELFEGERSPEFLAAKVGCN